MNKFNFTSIGILIVSLIFLGCNILGWTHDADNLEDKLSDAKHEMESGNYEEAKRLFDDIRKEDPTKSEAHWGYAKASFAIRLNMENIIDIGDKMLQDKLPEREPLVSPEDFGYDTWKEVNDFINQDIIEPLNVVLSGETDGVIDEKSVAVNASAGLMYFFSGASYLLSSSLNVLDENNNPVEVRLELSWAKDNPANPSQPGAGEWRFRYSEDNVYEPAPEQLDPGSDPFPETVSKLDSGLDRIIKAIEYTDVTNKEKFRDIRDVLETQKLIVAFLNFDE
jgi:hypothetical protein